MSPWENSHGMGSNQKESQRNNGKGGEKKDHWEGSGKGGGKKKSLGRMAKWEEKPNYNNGSLELGP